MKHDFRVSLQINSLALSLSRFLSLSLSLTLRSPASHRTCDVSFPPRRTGRCRKGMILARPSYKGVRRSVWETFAPGHKSRAEARPTGRAVSRERLGDWDGPMAVLAPLRLLTRQGGPRGQTESGGIVLSVNAGARAPRGGVTRQGVVLTDFQSLRDCQ
jgi:hypothetical protein